MNPLKRTVRGSLNLRFSWNGSPVMMDLSAAASSTNVPVSFSSVITAEMRISGSSMNGEEKSFSEMDSQEPRPSRLRMREHSVPLPLLPDVE